jgi:hypothetical protein
MSIESQIHEVLEQILATDQKLLQSSQSSQAQLELLGGPDGLGDLRELLHSIRHQLHYQADLLGQQTALLREIAADLAPEPSLTRSITIRFTGDSTMANNALVFNVGQTSQASILPLLADGTTPSGGTVSAVTFTFSDPSATVTLNADGLTATCTGVAASAGPISGSAACTVTDTDGVVSKWTQAFTIQTNAVVPPAQLTQSVAVAFSTPTP